MAEAAQPPPDGAKTPLERLLSIFTDVRAGEGPTALLMLMNIFALLICYSIIKIDRPMATHDAQILRFGQWWRRAVRAGHALGHRYARHGRTRFRDGKREIRSVLFWGLGFPLAVLFLLLPTRGLSLLLLGGYALLGWRVYRHYRRAGLSGEDAALAARFIVYGKFAEFLGVVRYWLNRMRGRFKIIEYK